MLTPAESARLEAVERLARQLARSAVQGPPASTLWGGQQVRAQQVGFPAQTTAAFDATRGYAWKRRALDLSVPGLANPGIQDAGLDAFAVSGDKSLAAGTDVWLEPNPEGPGYLLTLGGDGSFLACLTDVFVPGADDDPANCYVAGTDTPQFYTYSFREVEVRAKAHDTPQKLTYAFKAGGRSGTPCSTPAFHVGNLVVPVMRATGVRTDVDDCPAGAALGYKFTLTGLTGTPCDELNGLTWVLVPTTANTWAATQTTAAGDTTATLTEGSGSGTLVFAGAVASGLTYVLSPWACTGDVVLARTSTGGCSGTPATLTLTAQATIPLGTIDPLSVVRVWASSWTNLDGSVYTFYLFDRLPWVDLFRLTPDSDANGVVAYYRYLDQSDHDSGDHHGGEWSDGREVRVITAE